MKRGLRAVLVVGAFLLGVPVAGGWAAQAKERREVHYGIYFLGSRIGGMTIKQAPTKFKGRPAVRMDLTQKTKMVVMGEVEQTVDATYILDVSSAPLFLTMKMSSGGHATTIVASFFPDRVECTVDSQGTKSKKVIPIPKGVTLVADEDLVGEKAKKSGKLKPGTKMQFHIFEPVTLAIQPVEVEVLREEPLEINGKKVPATVVKSTVPLTGESTEWLGEDGVLLQDEIPLGMRIVQEDKPPAQVAGSYEPPVDFMTATSVKTATEIAEPRAVKFLRVRIRGIPEPRLVLSDARQQAHIETTGTALTALYEVRAEDEGRPTTDHRPLTNDEDDGATGRRGDGATGRTVRSGGPDLAAAPYLEVDDPRIRKQAAAIAAGDKDPAQIAHRIRVWVHEHMKAQTNIGVVRSATDILNSREGVCRDYATLFAALARAAGVPTRLCAGIVFFKGAFYYHAWDECRVGSVDNPWVPFDSTLGQDFVDATHIKFSEGDPTSMYQSARVIGQLKAEILEYH